MRGRHLPLGGYRTPPPAPPLHPPSQTAQASLLDNGSSTPAPLSGTRHAHSFLNALCMLSHILLLQCFFFLATSQKSFKIQPDHHFLWKASRPLVQHPSPPFTPWQVHLSWGAKRITSNEDNINVYLIKLLWGSNELIHKKCSINLTYSGRSLYIIYKILYTYIWYTHIYKNI